VTAESQVLLLPLQTSFIESLRIQGRVIKALCVRDIIGRYGREGLGFLWLFLEPSMFTAGVTALMSFVAHDTVDARIPIAGFALTGYSMVMLWRGITGKLMGGVGANKGLLYHRNVKVADLIYSRALVEMSACGTSLALLTLVFAALGLVSLPDDPLKVLAGWLLYAWFTFAVGCVFAFAASTSELFDRISHVALYLAIPLMGGFYMVAWTPAAVQEFLLMSPLVNAIELLREGYFGMHAKAQYSISYLIQFNLVLTLVGLILLRKIRRQLIDA